MMSPYNCWEECNSNNRSNHGAISKNRFSWISCYDFKGFKACEAFIHKRIINPHVNIPKLESKITSYKSLIIEWCQKKKLKLSFNCTEDQTAEKFKHFTVSLKIDNKIIAKARSTSRKKAEEKAAKRAYFALQNKINS